MSAYVVEDVTINRVLAYLYQQAASMPHPTPDESKLSICGHDLHHAAHRPEPALRDACVALGTAMHLLNVGAVRARYDDADDPEQNMIPEAYQYAFFAVTEVIAYKALSCWLYQCSEGNVPDSPLFKAMSVVHDGLAHQMAALAPGYEAAPWG